MSSTASVAPNVSYHLHHPLNDNFCHEVSHSETKFREVRICDQTQLNPSTLKSANALDKALQNSFKSSNLFVNPRSFNETNSPKFSQRSISFRESNAPSLDSVIRRTIEALPGSLILTSVKVDPLKGEDELLCSDEELNRWCQLGAQRVPRRALGFGNSGNTCYLNSVLQCILATGPLLAYIHAKHVNPNNCMVTTGRVTLPGMNKARFCGLCGLSRLLNEHIRCAQNSSGFPNPFVCGQTVPSYFVSNVRAVCPSLRPYQQEDAHEFLLGMLSRMEDSAMAGLGKLSRKISETNVVRRIFGGIMRSEVTCHTCQKVSARDEQWFNLSMDITCARSLQQGLFNYIRSEELSGSNAYKCENCRRLRPAMRRCTVFRAPPILIIQFNRFSRSQKLDTHVDFPSSFNLRPFMTQPKGSPLLYRLYATVNHEGYSCRSGHYVSFTRRHGHWLSHNDSYVASTNIEHVLRQSPYLLFYESVHSKLNVDSVANLLDEKAVAVPITKTSPLIVSPLSCNTLSAPSPSNLLSNIYSDTDLPQNSWKTCISASSGGVTCTTSKVSSNQVTPLTPRIVLNPKFSLNKLSVSVSPATVSFVATSSVSTVANTESTSRQIFDPSSSSMNNTSSVCTLTSSRTIPATKTTDTLSVDTVRHLLGVRSINHAHLWTERETPTIKEGDHNFVSTVHSKQSDTDAVAVGDPFSIQHSRKSGTPTCKRTFSALSSHNTDRLNHGKSNNLTNCFSNEISNVSVESYKRARTRSNDSSSSASSIVWVPSNQQCSADPTVIQNSKSSCNSVPHKQENQMHFKKIDNLRDHLFHKHNASTSDHCKKEKPLERGNSNKHGNVSVWHTRRHRHSDHRPRHHHYHHHRRSWGADNYNKPRSDRHHRKEKRSTHDNIHPDHFRSKHKHNHFKRHRF